MQQALLILMLNGYSFHGSRLVALNSFDFHFDQVTYLIEAITIKCVQCEHFLQYVRTQEQLAVQQQIERLAWRNHPRPNSTQQVAPILQVEKPFTEIEEKNIEQTSSSFSTPNNDDSKSVETLFDLLDLD